jgi:hypothetical protein
MTPPTWSTDIASHGNATSHHVTPARSVRRGIDAGDRADALAPYTDANART